MSYFDAQLKEYLRVISIVDENFEKLYEVFRLTFEYKSISLSRFRSPKKICFRYSEFLRLKRYGVSINKFWIFFLSSNLIIVIWQIYSYFHSESSKKWRNGGWKTKQITVNRQHDTYNALYVWQTSHVILTNSISSCH